MPHAQFLNNTDNKHRIREREACYYFCQKSSETENNQQNS